MFIAESVNDFLIDEYMAKLQARRWLFRALSSFYSSVKYSPINFFHWQTQRYAFLKLVSNSPPHLKYAGTLPCILSLIACFLTLAFHKVVWQHMHGVVRYLITTLLQIYQKISQWKTWKIGYDLAELWPWVCGLTFLAHLLDNDNIFVLYMKLGRVNIIYNEYN